MKRNRSRGFTMIEMMISLAIMGILLMGALPGYGVWVQNTQTRGNAESILSAMQLARAEAVRRNTDVQVTLAGAVWTVTVVRTGEVVQTRPPGEVSVNTTVTIAPADATMVTFNSLGRVTPNIDGSVSVSQVTVGSTVLAAPDNRELRTDIGLAGVIRMCDTLAPAGDPRACA